MFSQWKINQFPLTLLHRPPDFGWVCRRLLYPRFLHPIEPYSHLHRVTSPLYRPWRLKIFQTRIFVSYGSTSTREIVQGFHICGWVTMVPGLFLCGIVVPSKVVNIGRTPCVHSRWSLWVLSDYNVFDKSFGGRESQRTSRSSSWLVSRANRSKGRWRSLQISFNHYLFYTPSRRILAYILSQGCLRWRGILSKSWLSTL